MGKKISVAKKMVEEDLKNYPLWIISVDLPGLGTSTNWSKGYKNVPVFKSSSVENAVFHSEEVRDKVNIITGVLMYLRPLRRRIIEETYFRDIISRDELLDELKISKSTFYKEKDEAIKKLAIALRYL